MAEAAAKEIPVEEQAEQEAPPADPAPVFVKAPPIPLARFGLEAEYNQRWRATTPQGVSPEQVCDQAYWANVCAHFNPGDEITVMPDDMAWKMVLQVLGCGKLYAHVAVLHFYDFMKISPHEDLPSVYRVEFAGSHVKWRVLREGKPMRDGFRSRTEAARWAANHEAALNR
jgi:hypothetical protein